jgi:RNA polymerase sigma factor (sigma-70 family)
VIRETTADMSLQPTPVRWPVVDQRWCIRARWMPIFRGKPELLRGFRAGDRAALEIVYRAYVDKVTKVIRFGFKLREGDASIPGLRVNPVETADLVQEIFVKAFAVPAREAFDGLREYGPYLYAVARNVLADWGRRSGRELPTETDRLQQAGDDAWVPDDDELGPWADPDTIALVRRYLDGLDPELQRVHQARFVTGLSQRDAADQLGIGRQTLRTLEGRLRAGLERELERQR